MDLTAAQPFIDKLGIEFEESSAERVVATMPVEGNTQPDGILHGGATCSLVETLASFGAALTVGWPENLVVGQQQTCYFIRPATGGRVRGVATPHHVGRTTQIWDVDVSSVDTGKRIATGRVIMAVRPRPA
jgi:uncharacterized protein (TIGR00369 family)